MPALAVTSFETAVPIFGGLLVLGDLVAAIGHRSVLSLPAIFVLVGFVLGPGAIGVLQFDQHSDFVRAMATVYRDRRAGRHALCEPRTVLPHRPHRPLHPCANCRGRRARRCRDGRPESRCRRPWIERAARCGTSGGLQLHVGRLRASAPPQRGLRLVDPQAPPSRHAEDRAHARRQPRFASLSQWQRITLDHLGNFSRRSSPYAA